MRRALGLALVLVAAGCGGHPATEQPKAESGQAIFARSCSGCHTLTGREDDARAGDLLRAHLAVRDLASFARVMPVRPPLTRAQALAVARYIHARNRGGP